MADHKGKDEKIDKLTEAELRQFTGTENWYRHNLARTVLYTDGVQYLAEKAGAYWLIDIIATESVMLPNLKGEGFQVWKLTIDTQGSGADLVVDDGNGNELHRRHIAFTDFPLPEITLWCNENEDPSVNAKRVIMLPSEY